MASQYSLKRRVLPQSIYWIWLIVSCNVAFSIQSNDVDCIVYNEEFMECTWNHSEGKPNYTLYHWYSSQPAKECGNYIQQNGYNVGCNFSKSEITQFREFYVYRNGSGESGYELPLTRNFQLQNQVKLNPPEDLALNITDRNELILSWDTSEKSLKCRMYEVRYRSDKDKSWQVNTINSQRKYSLPSIDQKKTYIFQVRSKINEYCGSTVLWSEWSSPVQWGVADTDNVIAFRTIISAISLLGLILLLVALVKNERLKVIIIPKIPNPGRSFDPLFNNHNGNFQDWLGVPKDALEGFKSNYHENVCIVSESPANSTQSIVHGGSFEQHGSTQIPGKMSIPGNKGGIQPKSTSPAPLFSDIAVFVESNSSTRFG
ncbi:cytokine receptor common subunit gamma-like isoform X2 [Scyliorhinus torazame]|uniref:cytokine receptor common subunit gamma-like isoform X2 n=1 Tax=Scyliorhinus torazame TaxID=75743 RepID=UPI003B5994A4